MAEYGLPANNALSAYLGVRDSNNRQTALNANTAAQQVGILGMLQQQALRNQQVKQQQDLEKAISIGDPEALMRIPGGIGILKQLAEVERAKKEGAYRDMQMKGLETKSALEGRQQQAAGALANLMTPSGSFGQGTEMERPNAQVFGNDAEAIAAMREAEARGLPFTGNVPNPGNVRALVTAAGGALPANTGREILRGLSPEAQKPERPITPVTGGYIETSPDGTRKFVRTAEDRPQAAEPLVAITGDDGKPVLVPRSQAAGKAPARSQSSINFDRTWATQRQTQANRQIEGMQRNLLQVGMYDQARASGDTAQAAILAAQALRQSTRSSDRALKGEAERLLGSGYGSGSLAERMENFISQEFRGAPSKNTLDKIDKLIRASEMTNMAQIANVQQNYANQARARGVPLSLVVLPYVRGKTVSIPDGRVATFPSEQDAINYVNTWIEENQ